MSSNSRKRPADRSWEKQDAAGKAARITGHLAQPKATLPNVTESAPPVTYSPAILYPDHPDSKLCQNFHWLPYPLGLMPFDSWQNLHQSSDTPSPLPFRCPVCRSARKPTLHARKVFLVAERLTWEHRSIPSHEREENERLTWEVNYKLGILVPFVEAPEQVPGGKKSQHNKWHPYQNEFEMKQAFNLIVVSENLHEASWSLWLDGQKMLRSLVDTFSTSSPKEDKLRQLQETSGNRMQPKATESMDLTKSPDRMMSITYETLQDFYSLLDQIERSSYVGALFLEAYAERLRDDLCKECWVKKYIESDTEDDKAS